ncbi:efflux RND transporter periplasmic adaptor subunit [Jiella sp. M17.18]|uniref:HlyD family secretion protein n=1 Tax=Jiella sp. M17.18 TaxID=3234247 RepID=UPI0034DEBA8E
MDRHEQVPDDDTEGERTASPGESAADWTPPAPSQAPQARSGADDRGSGKDAGSAQPGADEAAEGKAKRGRKRRLYLFLFLGVVFLVVAAGAAYYYFFYASQYESTDDAFIDGDIVRVSPQVSGQLVAVPVADNAVVKPGDVLAKIDPAGPMAQLAVQKAQLSEAQASVGEAQAQLQKAKAAVAHDQSAYQAAQVQADNARQQAERYKELANKAGNAAISTQQLDDAEAQARQYEASARAAKTTVASDQAGVTAAEASLQSAKAKVGAAQANVDAAQVTVDNLTVKASIAGQVVQKNVNVGSYVSPGSQMMAIVPRDLYVTANFKETQLSDIKVGQTVDISVDALPDVKFHGTVRSIQRGAGQAFQVLPAQNATGNFVKVVQRVPVRISIDSPSPDKYPLGPGMSVVPTVHID